ncbi:hypothetical protein [Pseudomonas savastanoi]|uniref:hypothetical protein n=1 Tax=Pseudomonas savastanoi TaxID=29438 RepID=UPI0017827030|nr:hypothetical protein [Pseudomonas savastanoi]QOI07946.1 hypothetical protein D5S10_29935 [Pseudomonas savastanoi]
MSKLETTIIQCARDHLNTLRNISAEPESIERSSSLSTFNSMLDGLLMLGHIKDSGLSADAIEQLLSIERESSPLTTRSFPLSSGTLATFRTADGKTFASDLRNAKHTIIKGSDEAVSNLTDILRLHGRPAHTLNDQERIVATLYHREGRKMGVHVVLQLGKEAKETLSESEFLELMSESDAIVTVNLKP